MDTTSGAPPTTGVDAISPPVLLDERLVVRAPEPRDVDAVYDACQDIEIQRWTSVPVPYQREDAEKYVCEMCPRGWETGTGAFFLAFRPSGELVASLALMDLTLTEAGTPRMGELGYWAAAPARGQGLMTAAARLVCGWGFAELGLQRIEWYADVDNGPSRGVADRLGVRIEGRLRHRLVNRAGDLVDAWVGSLLPDDVR